MENKYIVVAVNYGTNKSTLKKIYDYVNKNGDRVLGIDNKSFITVDKLLDIGSIKDVVQDVM